MSKIRNNRSQIMMATIRRIVLSPKQRLGMIKTVQNVWTMKTWNSSNRVNIQLSRKNTRKDKKLKVLAILRTLTLVAKITIMKTGLWLVLIVKGIMTTQNLNKKSEVERKSSI